MILPAPSEVDRSLKELVDIFKEWKGKAVGASTNLNEMENLERKVESALATSRRKLDEFDSRSNAPGKAAYVDSMRANLQKIESLVNKGKDKTRKQREADSRSALMSGAQPALTIGNSAGQGYAPMDMHAAQQAGMDKQDELLDEIDAKLGQLQTHADKIYDEWRRRTSCWTNSRATSAACRTSST